MNEQYFTTGTIGISTYSPPQIVGYWRMDSNLNPIGAFQIAMRMKPTDEQIKNTEQMFGWKWIDA